MKKLMFCAAVIFFTLPALTQQQPTQPESSTAKFPSASTFANAKLTYKIIDAAGKTYCYDVYADGKLMIHQSSIPGLPGNKGFATKADAEKVAQLVVKKIKNGEMPPTISIEEMQKLKVIK